MAKLNAPLIMKSAEECLKFLPKDTPLPLAFISEYVRNYMNIDKREWNKKYEKSGLPIGKNGVQHELRRLKVEFGEEPIFYKNVRGYWTRLRDY